MATILHTESSVGWGGQEIRVYLEVVHLRERGHRMLLACHPESQLAKRAERSGLEVCLLSFRSSVDPRLTREIYRLLTRERVELVNTHSSVDSWVASLAARMARVPVVRTRHLSVPVKRNPVSRLVYSTLCDSIVTTAEAIRHHFLEELHLDPSKVISIPTGVDLSVFNPNGAEGNRVRQEFGVGEGTPLIGIVAVLRSWKGHRLFLDAVPLILEKAPRARFLIVGDGPIRGNIRRWIEEVGLAGVVRMVGHREDIPDILAALDVVVSASTAAEGVPQALLQALAMRRPVVATPVGGVPQVIRHGETGLLVPPGDPGALAAAITSLLSDAHRGAALGIAGRRLIEKEFALETMLDRLEVLYAEILAARRILIRDRGEERRANGLGRGGEGRRPGEARAFFEREAVNYAAHYYESPDPVTRALKQQRLDLLACLVRGCVRPPARVLDVGSAEGPVEVVLPPGLHVVVLDLAVGRVAAALVRVPELRGVAGDGGVLPFRDGAFDLAICSATLDHLPDPFTGMRELARVVRPGGHVLVALDNRFKLFKRRIRVNEPTIDPNAHFNRLDYWKFRRLLRGTGLAPIRIAAFGFPFRTHERWVRRWPAVKPWLDRVGVRWPALSYEYQVLLRKDP